MLRRYAADTGEEKVSSHMCGRGGEWRMTPHASFGRKLRGDRNH